MRIGYSEVFLIQIIVYALVYLADSYVGFLLTLIMGCIAVAIMILSFVFELIERSKVPKEYYIYMLTAVIAPFLVLIGFSIGMTGSLDWMGNK